MSGSITLEIQSRPVYPTPKGVTGTETTQDRRTSPGAAEAMPGVQTAAEIHAATISTMTLRRTRRFAGWFISVFPLLDRKSTRLNSSHGYISYAVFCLKKKKKTQPTYTIVTASRHMQNRRTDRCANAL